MALAALAGAALPAADAARVVVGDRGGVIITVLSIISLPPMLNAILMIGTRILFAMGRDGFVSQRAASVTANGTPAVAMLATTIVALVLIATGTFQRLVAVVGEHQVEVQVLAVARALDQRLLRDQACAQRRGGGPGRQGGQREAQRHEQGGDPLHGISPGSSGMGCGPRPGGCSVAAGAEAGRACRDLLDSGTATREAGMAVATRDLEQFVREALARGQSR